MIEVSPRRSLACMAVAAILALVATGQPQQSFAQQPEPKTFSSATEASQALFQAAENHDQQALQAILGADKDLTSTDDDAQDKLEREQFCQKYKQMHRLVREPDGTTVLYIGAENWPFPIPLTSRNGRWSFDAQTGKEEMLFRRIGENEAAAIEVGHALAAAGTPQGTAGNDDPIQQFAEGVASHANTGNNNDSTSGQVQKEPFYGYYFRDLSAPAANTAAGTAGTTGSARKAGRVAFVAYPAEYRSSGVMTFIVTTDGVVYQKDLGPDTSKLAMSIQTSKPGAGWRIVK
jgi:hypothetical protein